jgi:two-component system, NarL family, sensor histidine kinase FusK
MGKRWWTNEWLLQVGIAAGYALFYLAIHPFSTAHWPIHAGVRLACLLLIPYRYWPALLIGEALPNAYAVIPCTDQGLAWIAFRCIPPFAAAMPIVWWCRAKFPPLPSRSEQVVDIKALLTCILLVALGSMAYSWIASSLSITVQSPLAILPWMIGYFLGPYLAILSVVPCILMARIDYQHGRLREQMHQMLASRLLLDTVALLIPSVLLLAWLNQTGSQQVKLIATISMFLPMAWLTLKHGWRAVAVSAPLVIACISLPIPLENDPGQEYYATLIFLAIAVTSLFALGARISVQMMKEEDERLGTLNVQRVARQSLQLSEQRMRQTSQALEYLAGTLHITNGRLLEQMRRIVPNIESHAFYKQAVATQTQVYRLAESMHPVAWRERGLPAALNETVARALDEAGIAYRCTISGRGFSRLAPAVLTASYRTTCEAVVYVTSRLACTRVNLVLRGGETHGTRWVLLRVEGILEETGVASAVYHTEERKRLGAKLGASMLDIPEMRDHVRIFDGLLHLRKPAGRLQITALLHDAVQEEQRSMARLAPPLRLWVR